MLTIYKYQLPTGVNELALPQGAELLHVDLQHGSMNLWAKVDTDRETETRTVHIIGTGHEVPQRELKFINTFLVNGGQYVFHAFEELRA